jgi:leader peptidase (prepilin peptidase)/N-methyltransferase
LGATLRRRGGRSLHRARGHSAIDIERRVVPNVIVLPAAAIVLVLMEAWQPSIEWPLAGLGAAFFLFLAALAYPRGMGMGDVKLALLLGVAVGRYVPIALFAGMVFALVPSAVLFARHGSAARKMAIPFAPFLALGGLLAPFAGPAIAHWYLRSRISPAQGVGAPRRYLNRGTWTSSPSGP